MRAEKRKVCTLTPVTKEVECTYIECVPTTTIEKRKCLQYTCVPTTVECEVPCWSTVMVPCCTPPSCCNPCGSVSYTCQRVCTMQKVQRTVMKSVATEVEVNVPVTTYARVEKKAKRMVTPRSTRPWRSTSTEPRESNSAARRLANPRCAASGSFP